MAKIYYFMTDREGRSMKQTTIFDVADYFLTLVDQASGSVMTHLKLQKLCYYAQAWHLVFTGNPIFENHFEAWAHGPVCPDLWHKYKEYRYEPIPAPEYFDTQSLCPEVQETLDEVWNTYGSFDAKYLERLTHQEKPWIEARQGCRPGDRCDTPINIETMREYYSAMVGEQ